MKDFKEMTDAELKAVEVDKLEVGQLAAYYNENNDRKRKELEILIEDKATKADIIAIQKEYATIKDKQIEMLNEKLKEQGLAIAKFEKGDGQTKIDLGAQIVKNLKERAAELKNLRSRTTAQTFSFEIEKAAGTMMNSTNITGQLPVVEMIPGMEPIASRKTWIKGVLRKGSVSGNIIAWVDQANKDGSAGITAEGAAKNQIDFDLVVRTEELVKYTAFIKISEEMLDDIDFINGEIKNELLVELDLAVDAALLVLVQAAATAWAAGGFALKVPVPTTTDVIMTAENQIKLANFEPNHILLHPTDVTKIKMEKDANGAYLKNVYTDKGVTYINGMRVIENSGMTEDNFLVFDASKATVYTKNKSRVEVGRDSDDFTKNLVTILAEERDLLVIKTNNKAAFVKGVISTAKTAITAP